MPTLPFQACLLEDDGNIVRWRNGDGRDGFDKNPDHHKIDPNDIVMVIKSNNNPGHVVVKSPNGATTLSSQKDGKKEIREGTHDSKWEQGYIIGGRYLQMQSKQYTLLDPVDGLPF